jgi:hypothetical protein
MPLKLQKVEIDMVKWVPVSCYSPTDYLTRLSWIVAIETSFDNRLLCWYRLAIWPYHNNTSERVDCDTRNLN